VSAIKFKLHPNEADDSMSVALCC